MDPTALARAIVPLYKLEPSGSEYSIHLFMTKINFDGGVYWYMKEHGFEVPLYVFQNNKYIQMKKKDWTRVATDTIRTLAGTYSVPGKNALSATTTVPGLFYFIARDPVTTNVTVAAGSGTFNDITGEYLHGLTTLPGQCGCPYLNEKGEVFALHGGTTGQMNFGHLLSVYAKEPECVKKVMQGARVEVREGVYKNLRFVGRTTAKMVRYADDYSLVRYPSLIKEIYPPFWNKLQDLYQPDYYATSINDRALTLSQMKMDEVRLWSPDLTIWRFVQDIMDNAFSVIDKLRPLTHDEIINHIDMTKGPGIPFCNLAVKKRSEFLELPDARELLEYPEESIPIYKVTPKNDEWYKSTLIKQYKCRTFIIPPFHLLYHQIKYTHNSSEAIKGFWWSAYGFNPFCGGTHRLALKLLSKRFRFMWDWKGWDRQVRLQSKYDRWLKNALPLYTERERIQAQWMVKHTTSSIIRLLNGDIVQRIFGNNSGAGKTTPDNIEANIEAMIYLLTCCYLEKMRKMPTQAEITEQVLSIFGDDSIGAVDEEFSYITIEDNVRKYSKNLALDVQDFVGGDDVPLEKLRFLGFTFIKYGDWYLPQWDRERMITAMLWNRTRESNLEKTIQRQFSLAVMSFGDPELYSVAKTLYHLILIYAAKTTFKTATITSFLVSGPILDDEVAAFYLGTEGSSGFKFFPGEEVEVQKTTMASVLTVFKPTITKQVDDTYVCVGLVQGVSNTPVTGTGTNEISAFSSWLDAMVIQVYEEALAWIPNSTTDVKMRALKEWVQKFFEGGFNPFGNGQPILTRKQYLAKYKNTRLKGVTSNAEREKIYAKYVEFMMTRSEKRQRMKPVKIPQRNANEIGATRKPRRMQVRSANVLSPCARKYAAALINPFSMVDGSQLDDNAVINNGVSFDPSDACIPTMPPLKSRRLKVFTNGNLTCQPDGRSALLFAPYRMANNNVANNTAPPVLVLQPTAGMVAGQAFFSADNGGALGAVDAYSFNSEYTVAALTTVGGRGIEGRLVAAGIRIRYTGSELNRAGTIWAVTDPSHDTLANLQYNQIAQLESNFKNAVTRNWVTLTYTPMYPTDLTFTPDPGANASTNQGIGHFLGFALTNCGAGVQFEWEAVALFEVIGQGVRDLKPAIADANGLSMVTNVLSPNTQKVLNDYGPAATLKNVINEIGEISGAVTKALPNVMGVVKMIT